MLQCNHCEHKRHVQFLFDQESLPETNNFFQFLDILRLVQRVLEHNLQDPILFQPQGHAIGCKEVLIDAGRAGSNCVGAATVAVTARGVAGTA